MVLFFGPTLSKDSPAGFIDLPRINQFLLIFVRARIILSLFPKLNVPCQGAGSWPNLHEIQLSWQSMDEYKHLTRRAVYHVLGLRKSYYSCFLGHSMKLLHLHLFHDLTY